MLQHYEKDYWFILTCGDVYTKTMWIVKASNSPPRKIDKCITFPSTYAINGAATEAIYQLEKNFFIL